MRVLVETLFILAALVALPACSVDPRSESDDSEQVYDAPRDANTSAPDDVISPASSGCEGCGDAVEVAGGTSLCARFSNGEVHCQPRDFRQREPKSEALEPTGIVDAIQLVAGHDRFCVLRSSGQVVCWGALEAQGGDQQVWDMPTPIEGLDGIVRIVSGFEFYMLDSTCAQDESGRVWCWGGWEFEFEPESVMALDGLSQLASTYGRRCGIRDLSTLVCLGDNYGVTTRELELKAPAEQLALAWGHGCARDVEGKVTCFKLDRAHELFAPRIPASQTLVGTTLAVCSLSSTAEVHCVGEEGDVAVQKELAGVRLLFPRANEVCGLMPSGVLRCVTPNVR